MQSFPPVSSFTNDDFDKREESVVKPPSIFTELDPLGVGRTKPLVDPKLFFQDVKNPPKKMLKELCTNNIAGVTFTKIEDADKLEATLSNSFSSHFNPQSEANPNEHRYEMPKTLSSPHQARLSTSTTRSSGCESPPPGSPLSLVSNNEYFLTNGKKGTISSTMSNCSTPPLLPPPSTSIGNHCGTTSSVFKTPPSGTGRLKKSHPQLLKQITISGAISSPSQSPRSSASSSRYEFAPGSSAEEIPSLVPPPRPPHSSNSGAGSMNTLTKLGSSTKAVPRPSSGSSGDRGRKNTNISSFGMSGGMIPPEPPPRPIQSTMITMPPEPMQLVSPPPPLPPKKHQGMSSGPFASGKFSDPKSEFTFAQSSSKNNDLPLPLPSRKRDELCEQLSGGHNNRYEEPMSTMSLCEDVPHRVVKRMTMEQALSQVASLSLGDMARRLCLPVEKLSSLTIQQLAEKLIFDQHKGLESHRGKIKEEESSTERKPTGGFGFEDDFAPASAPLENTPATMQQRNKGNDYDKYAVFRELTLEDASGFSVENEIRNCGSSMESVSDDGATLKDFKDHLTSSSEQTLRAEDNLMGSMMNANNNDDLSISAINSIANNNTMDDITDGNLSEDDARFNLELDDDNIIGKGTEGSQWATFESNFEDQFASLMKDNDDEEEESSEEEKSQQMATSAQVKIDVLKDPFDFEPFEKPKSLVSSSTGLPVSNSKSHGSNTHHARMHDNNIGVIEKPASVTRHLDTSDRDLMSSPGGNFTRQSSCSSKHSREGRLSEDYSDSPGGRRRRSREEEYPPEEEDPYRPRSGRRPRGHHHRLHDSYRPDSRSSYSSMQRRKPRYIYRDDPEAGSEEPEDEIVSIEDPPNANTNSMRKKSSRHRHRDYYPDENEAVRPTSGREYLGPEEDDRSYASSANSVRGYHNHSQKSRRHTHEDAVPGRRRRHHYDYYDQEPSPPTRRRSDDRRRYEESDDWEEEESPYDSGDSHRRRGPRQGSKHSEYSGSRASYHYNSDTSRRHHRPSSSTKVGVDKPSDRLDSSSGKRSSSGYYSHYGTNPRTSSPRDDKLHGNSHHYHRNRNNRSRRYYYDDEEDFSDDFSGASDDEQQYYYSKSRRAHHHHGRRPLHHYNNKGAARSPSWDSESGPEPRRRPSVTEENPDDSSPSRRREHGGAVAKEGKVEEGKPDKTSFENSESPRTRMHRSHEMANLTDKNAIVESTAAAVSVSQAFDQGESKSPFEDNFMPVEDTTGSGSSKTEEKLMFFPASFDEAEVITKQELAAATVTVEDSLPGVDPMLFSSSTSSMSPIGVSGECSTMVGSVGLTKRGGSFSKVLVSRLESIRSEEEDGGGNSTTTVAGDEKPKSCNNNEDLNNSSSVPNVEDEELNNMKKSDSFNIFQQAKVNDPFAEDDFFA